MPAYGDTSLNLATASNEDILSVVDSNNINNISAFLTRFFQEDSTRFYSLLNDLAQTNPDAIQATLDDICDLETTPPGTSCTQLTALVSVALHNNPKNIALTQEQRQAALDAIANIEPAAGPDVFERLNLNLDDDQFSAN